MPAWQFVAGDEDDEHLKQVEWNFIKTTALTLLVLMTISLILFFGLWVASR